jgi:Nucleotidyltransferase domain
MHIYAFGSLCRGQVDLESDVDLLAIVDGHDDRFDPTKFSVYSYKRLREIWQAGNPFAWHLSLEAKMLFSENGNDFLSHLGLPSRYSNCLADCKRFLQLFEDAAASLKTDALSTIFDLSTVFLSIRNFATCYSLGKTRRPDFSRQAALSMETFPALLKPEFHRVIERARILCTRGYGTAITASEVSLVRKSLAVVHEWMETTIGGFDVSS